MNPEVKDLTRNELEKRLFELLEEKDQLNQQLRAEIEEKKQIELELKASEALYRDIFERAAIGIIRSGAETREGSFFEVNKAACEFIGYSKQELAKLNIPDFSHPDDLELDKKMLMGLMMGEYPYYKLEKRFVKKSGEEIWGNLTVSLVRNPDGSPNFTVATIEDISRRKQAEAELLASHENLETRVKERTHQLKTLSEKLINAQENERLRVSHELHDSVIQTMSIAKFQSELLKQSIELSPKGEHSANYIIKLLTQSIEDLRQICHNLRPSTLDDLGLLPAVRGLLDDFEKRTDTSYNIQRLCFPTDLSKDKELIIYRAFQEMLNNIDKHAEASEVIVESDISQAEVIIEVTDNGKGCDTTQLKLRQKDSGWGLISMQERLETIQGQLIFESRPNEGTHYTVKIPILDAADVTH